MRQRFETAADVAREREVVEKIGRVLGCEYRKCPEQYRVDYALLRERRIERFCEVKCRDVAYDTFWISLAKWIALVQLGGVAPKPSLLAVQWPQLPVMVFVVPRIGKEMPLCWGGRKVARDDQDSEPLIEIPLDRFQILEE